MYLTKTPFDFKNVQTRTNYLPIDKPEKSSDESQTSISKSNKTHPAESDNYKSISTCFSQTA